MSVLNFKHAQFIANNLIGYFLNNTWWTNLKFVELEFVQGSIKVSSNSCKASENIRILPHGRLNPNPFITAEFAVCTPTTKISSSASVVQTNVVIVWDTPPHADFSKIVFQVPTTPLKHRSVRPTSSFTLQSKIIRITVRNKENVRMRNFPPTGSPCAILSIPKLA